MTRHRMAPADAAWLHMDRRTNRSVVTSVMWFDEMLDLEELRRVLDERLIRRFPRFSQRVVDRTTSVWWEDVDDFDLDGHVHVAALPAPGGPRELHRYVSGLLDRPLDRSRPLWEMHVVAGYGGSGCAVISRMHHCIADGMSLTRLVMSLTDDPKEAQAAGLTAAPPVERTLGGRLGETTRQIVAACTRPGETLRESTAAVRSLARLAALPPDAHTSLRGPVGERKTVVWTEPVPLPALKDAAHAYGVTVNDLALSAISGALRAYLARTDGYARDIRGVVPINLRPMNRPLPVELGNAFGLLYLDLPLSIDDPVERLREISRRTASLKHSAEPFVSYRLLRLTGHLPYEAEQKVVDLFSTKASLVITNVAGPRRPVCLAGRAARGTIGWPPESGTLGLGLSIISYDGSMIFGALADAGLIADPGRIVEDVQSQLERLLQPVSA